MKHEIGRRQSWTNADNDIQDFVEQLARDIARLLAPAGFVGAYLHGSLAMGSFYRPKSDIDLLFVIEHSMRAEHRQEVALALCDWSDRRPIIGDIEISVLRKQHSANFTRPLPFELHYGEEHKNKIRTTGIEYDGEQRDEDLSAHCTVAKKCGIRLSGEPIEEVFGTVPVEFYRESILGDLDWILEGDHILESPFYAVLNCCRVLALNTIGWNNVLNKEEGGEWALANLPSDHQAVVSQALACYRNSAPVSPPERRTDGHAWDQESLRQFRDYVSAITSATQC